MKRSGSKSELGDHPHPHIHFSVSEEEVHEIPAYSSSDSEEADELNAANTRGLNQSGRFVSVSPYVLTLSG